MVVYVVYGVHTVTERGVFFLSKSWGIMANTSGMKLPDDFCNAEGWCRANNYGLREEDFESKAKYSRERFKRSVKVMCEFRKTDQYKNGASIAMRANWEERAAAAKRASDTTEILLLEKLVERSGGDTTAELIANAINNIAAELAKRGIRDIDQLETKELVLISNTLMGLAKAASAVKKAEGWKPQVQVNNVTVNNSSKTGGVVGGLEDVIDIRKSK